jgi:hypothetical protein
MLIEIKFIIDFVLKNNEAEGERVKKEEVAINRWEKEREREKEKRCMIVPMNR